MPLNPDQEALVQCLQACATQAERCAVMATHSPGSEACVSACRDMAGLCWLGSELLSRESPMADWLLPIAELACATCVDACEEQLGSLFNDCLRQCRELPRTLDRVQRRHAAVGTRSRPAVEASPQPRAAH
jgi:hypothetical protein